MHNPDPKKYVLKKLRNGDLILVDRQILRWRKRGKKQFTPPKPTAAKRAESRAKAKPQAKKSAREFKLFED